MLQWDPTGQVMATCAQGDRRLCIWSHRGEGLSCAAELPHPVPVTSVEWCSMIGASDDKRLMIAGLVGKECQQNHSFSLYLILPSALTRL